MANYVKFIRGTPQAYKNLAPNYDADTLYFICEKDDDDGALYLGAKLIANGDDDNFSLAGLKDIIIKEVGNKHILVYNEDQKAWVNVDYESLFKNFVGATAHSSGVAGLVPAPIRGKTNLFLRSDGTWAEVTSSSTATNIIYSLDNTNLINHNTLIKEATADANLSTGDIFIIRDIIAKDKYQHTAYTYNGSVWVALDGNYNAENVYFTEDFIFTENIGTIEIPSSGNVSVAASGLNVKEFFTNIFKQEKNPIIEQPSAKIELSLDSLEYEVGTIIQPQYSIEFSPGSYSYDEETKVSSTYIVQDKFGNTLTEPVAAFPSFMIEDNGEYNIKAIVNYTDGKIPVTNLGNPYSQGQIKAGTLDTLYSNTIKGYRNCFYGTFLEKAELTSDTIRSLMKTNKRIKNDDIIEIPIPKDTMRIVIAYPEDIRDISSIRDTNAMNVEIVSSFEKYFVDVAGENNYMPIKYKVFILDYAYGIRESNTYKVTI